MTQQAPILVAGVDQILMSAHKVGNPGEIFRADGIECHVGGFLSLITMWP